MPVDFIKKRHGRLDTPHLIFKSHKTMCSEQTALQQFPAFPSRFVFSFLQQRMKGRTVLIKTNSMHSLTGVCV